MRRRHWLMLAVTGLGGLAAAGLSLRPASLGPGSTAASPPQAPTPPGQPAPRADPALRAELARLAERLAAVEARLATSEREVLQWQLYVQNLVVNQGQPGQGAPPPPPPATRTPPSLMPGGQPLPDLPTGALYGDVVAKLGAPERVEGDGKRLCYYQQGLEVVLDEFGGVAEVVLYGVPTGAGPPDANGNESGLFEAEGRWFRPSRYAPDGVVPGTSALEVVKHLGYPDQVRPDAYGQRALFYEARGLVVILSADPPDFTVLRVRVGGGPPYPDANGAIR